MKFETSFYSFSLLQDVEIKYKSGANSAPSQKFPKLTSVIGVIISYSCFNSTSTSKGTIFNVETILASRMTTAMFTVNIFTMRVDGAVFTLFKSILFLYLIPLSYLIMFLPVTHNITVTQNFSQSKRKRYSFVNS